MPEFHINVGSFEDGKRFAGLDAFTRGYLEAMFFTACDGDDQNEDLTQASFAELAPKALEGIIADCKKFREDLPKDQHGRTALDLACDYASVVYDEERAGNDFWFTRNHHGTGYWDRGLGQVGEDLSTAAHKFRETDLYRDLDGFLYLEG